MELHRQDWTRTTGTPTIDEELPQQAASLQKRTRRDGRHRDRSRTRRRRTAPRRPPPPRVAPRAAAAAAEPIYQAGARSGGAFAQEPLLAVEQRRYDGDCEAHH